ncbi:MAG: hypothetical protein WC829_21935 [Hyphomicrobium sp.]|jgi:hypothetical protein
MKRYVVLGRVHPERADVRFTTISLGIGSTGKAQVSCDSSQLAVVLTDCGFDGFLSAYIAAEQFASLVTNALGFYLGTGYSIELIQIVEDDGTPHVIGARPNGPDGEILGLPEDEALFERALRLSVSDVFLRFAIADYIRAITDIGDCGTYCYRAIESIKSACAFTAKIDSWQPMHDALGTSRDEIEQIVKKFADPVRHGNWIELPPTTGVERYTMLKLTRNILLSYIAHIDKAVKA